MITREELNRKLLDEREMVLVAKNREKNKSDGGYQLKLSREHAIKQLQEENILPQDYQDLDGPFYMRETNKAMIL
jgi:hypothetical protein